VQEYREIENAGNNLMSIYLEHPEAKIQIEELPNGKRRVTIDPLDASISVPYRNCETSYPRELIEQILRVKGPINLCDEIRRDEDPLYAQICLEKNILGYVADEAFKDKRLLDFGCGCGASTMILARMFPATRIVGIELSSDLLSIAKLRAQYYGFEHVEFWVSPSGKELPENIGEFDFVVLSAVVEHLLPDERKVILNQLWSVLKPGGVLFIDQTPYRYFPFEGHTSQLPFINYLPDKLAHIVACRFSKRLHWGDSWESLLRRGVRGSSVREIMGILQDESVNGHHILLKPNRFGFHDRIDLWYAGYAVSITNKYPKAKHIQRIMKYIFKIIYLVSGVVMLPTLSLAIRKQEKL